MMMCIKFTTAVELNVYVPIWGGGGIGYKQGIIFGNYDVLRGFPNCAPRRARGYTKILLFLLIYVYFFLNSAKFLGHK